MNLWNNLLRSNKIFLLILILASTLCVSCNTEDVPVNKSETGFIPAKAGMYDCADTAVVISKNTKEKTITLFNLTKERNYTLSYDGTSKVYDKYGSSMSMEQIMEGDIADLTFLKSKKHLNSLALSNESWNMQQVSKFTINPSKKEIQLPDGTYQYHDNVFICSDEKNAEIMDINQCDTLHIQGIGHRIYSIVVEKGHGYLRLKNDEYFLGGWIEVGQEIIQTISEDMLLAVPEGTYQVLVTNKGVEGTKSVTIKRNEETQLDIGDLKGEEIKKYGTLIFAVTPDTATIYIDGEEIDKSEPFKTEYGIHQMMAKEEGYQTVVQYIKVGQENATIQVTLEKQGTITQAVSDNSIAIPSPTPFVTPIGVTPPATVSENNTVTSTGYKVNIDAPADVEVYVDGNYIGISPVSFKKVAGSHVVTLRKTGYSTRSYTINVDEDNKDASFSFSDLKIIE